MNFWSFYVHILKNYAQVLGQLPGDLLGPGFFLCFSNHEEKAAARWKLTNDRRSQPVRNASICNIDFLDAEVDFLGGLQICGRVLRTIAGSGEHGHTAQETQVRNSGPRSRRLGGRKLHASGKKGRDHAGRCKAGQINLCSLVFISHQRPDNRYDCEPQKSQPSNCKNFPGFVDEEPKLDRADDNERQTSKSTVKETGAPVRRNLQCARPTMRRLLDCVFAHRRVPYRNAAVDTAEPNMSAAICAWSNSTCG